MQTKFDKIKKMHVCLKKIKYKRKKKFFFCESKRNFNRNQFSSACVVALNYPLAFVVFIVKCGLN